MKSQPASSLLSLEAAEVLDRMREGADRMKNNTNSFLSGELVGLVPVRISVAAETEENSLRIKPIPRHPPHMLDGECFLNQNFETSSYPRIPCVKKMKTL